MGTGLPADWCKNVMCSCRVVMADALLTKKEKGMLRSLDMGGRFVVGQQSVASFMCSLMLGGSVCLPRGRSHNLVPGLRVPFHSTSLVVLLTMRMLRLRKRALYPLSQSWPMETRECWKVRTTIACVAGRGNVG